MSNQPHEVLQQRDLQLQAGALRFYIFQELGPGFRVNKMFEAPPSSRTPRARPRPQQQAAAGGNPSECSAPQAEAAGEQRPAVLDKELSELKASDQQPPILSNPDREHAGRPGRIHTCSGLHAAARRTPAGMGEGVLQDLGALTYDVM